MCNYTMRGKRVSPRAPRDLEQPRPSINDVFCLGNSERRRHTEVGQTVDGEQNQSHELRAHDGCVRRENGRPAIDHQFVGPWKCGANECGDPQTPDARWYQARATDSLVHPATQKINPPPPSEPRRRSEPCRTQLAIEAE